MLISSFQTELIEAGCDEAGRGCLAGDVFAAAVILPKHYKNDLLNDSKKLNATKRYELRSVIEQDAVAWGVASVARDTIDEINILNAALLAMHKAINQLSIRPQLLLIDGNRFKPFEDLPHQCIIGGDGKYLAIAAASILAKTYRDDYMEQLHQEYPNYGWNKNKGYGTMAHRAAIIKYGTTPHHRMSFRLTPDQTTLNF